MSEPGERPRWSITWLLRIQRVGRNRREVEPTAEQEEKRQTLWRAATYVVLGMVLLVEIAIGFWLGILPR